MRKKNSKATILKILKYLKPYSVLAVLSRVFAAGSGVLTLYFPIVMGYAQVFIIYSSPGAFESVF